MAGVLVKQTPDLLSHWTIALSARKNGKGTAMKEVRFSTTKEGGELGNEFVTRCKECPARKNTPVGEVPQSWMITHATAMHGAPGNSELQEAGKVICPPMLLWVIRPPE